MRANRGLVLAGVELAGKSVMLDLPPWAGAEVSTDLRYFNTSLAVMPFNTFPEH